MADAASFYLVDVRTLRSSEDDFRKTLVEPPDVVPTSCVEAQNALRVARESAISAIESGGTLNALQKRAEGKNAQGRWTAPAEASLRSSILFAGAGLDRALKQLAADCIPNLLKSDTNVLGCLQRYAENFLKADNEAGVDNKALARLLLGTGPTPRDIIAQHWIRSLESSSAQSAERVQEIASALGVTDTDLRRRVRPTSSRSSALEVAFSHRNKIAHELDIVLPEADTRQKFERIQSTRNRSSTRAHVKELIDVAQLLILDVAGRVTQDALTEL